MTEKKKQKKPGKTKQKKRVKKSPELVDPPKAKGAHPFLICYPGWDQP